MANQKRSQQYDWFKGPAAKGGPKDRKAQAKKVWKFSKIFIYLTLFVFSLTGCIQSLILKTTNYVGTGVEFFTSEAEVAPHVSRVDITHKLKTADAPEVYNLMTPASNLWLNDQLKSSDPGKASLADVHKAVAAQSTEGTLKLSDAFRGSNEALWISKPGASQTFDGVSAVETAKGVHTPLVLSSLADKSGFHKMGTSAPTIADADLFNGVNYYTVDKSTGVYSYTKLGSGTLRSFVNNPEYGKYIYGKIKDNIVSPLKVAFKKTDGSDITETDTVTVDDMFSAIISGIGKLYATNAKDADKALVQFDAIKKDYDTAVARQSYTLAALRATVIGDGTNNPILEWLSNGPEKVGIDEINNWGTASKLLIADVAAKTTAFETVKTTNAKTDQVYKNAEAALKASEKTLKTNTDHINYLKEQVAVRQYFLQGDGGDHKGIMGTFGLDLTKSSDITEGFTFVAGFAPFMSNSQTTWRPLVTWGDAWGEGPFYGLFVYPTAYVSSRMIASFPGGMAGWETLITIFVVVFSMRLLAFLLSFKATMQQTRMQELAAKKAVIDAKYAPYKGNKQMENRQRQEVSEMYKKQGVSPFGSMTSIFITMPLFLAIWRTIGALPHIKSAVWLGINFSATSWRELFAGSFQYLPLMILAAAFAAFQQILPRLLTKRRDKTRINVQQKAAMKKGNKTQNIMMLVFVFMALIFSAGLQVYWIAGGVWMCIQSTLTHFLIIRQSKNNKKKRIKT